MSVIEITSESHFSELTKTAPPTKLLALYFHTPWAAPCIQMNTVFNTLAEANPSVGFISINADDHPDISELFDVTSVPYFALIRNGTIVKELSGTDPKEFVAALNESNTKAAPAADSTVKPSGAGGAPAAESTEQLNDRLKKLTAAAPVMLFMKGTPAAPQCGFSRQLVAILREHQVKFGFFDILKDDSVRQGLKAFSDWPTFPQLYVSGEFQGGLDIVKENLEDDPHFFANAV